MWVIARHGGGDVRRAFEAAASVAGPISLPYVITVATVRHDDCGWSTHTASGQSSCPREQYIRPHKSTYHASHRRDDCLWSSPSQSRFGRSNLSRSLSDGTPFECHC